MNENTEEKQNIIPPKEEPEMVTRAEQEQEELTEHRENRSHSLTYNKRINFFKDREVRVMTPFTMNQNKIKKFKLYEIMSVTKEGDQNTRTQVSRRYGDFYWLQDQLLLIYYDHLVPKLPPKKILASFDMEGKLFKETRRRQLENYLNKLISTPVFHGSAELYNFIEMNPCDFHLYKQNYAIFIDTSLIKESKWRKFTSKFEKNIFKKIIKHFATDSELHFSNLEIRMTLLDDFIQALQDNSENFIESTMKSIHTQKEIIFTGEIFMDKNNVQMVYNSKKWIEYQSFLQTQNNKKHIFLEGLKDLLIDMQDILCALKRRKIISLKYSNYADLSVNAEGDKKTQLEHFKTMLKLKLEEMNEYLKTEIKPALDKVMWKTNMILKSYSDMFKSMMADPFFGNKTFITSKKEPVPDIEILY